MHSRHETKAELRSGWTMDTRSIGLALGWTLVIVLLAFVFRERREPRWSRAQGTIQDTRIVADSGWESPAGGQLTWKAEYKVAYFVRGREYVVWIDSGIREESEAGVRLTLPHSHPPCRVEYDVLRPQRSVGDCP